MRNAVGTRFSTAFFADFLNFGVVLAFGVGKRKRVKKMKRPTATNFFERQESARKRTWLLVFLFMLGVLGTVAACVALVAAIGAAANSSENEEWARLFVKYATTPELCAWVSGIVGGLILLVTLYKICELRRIGASGVAEALGGTRIGRSVKNPDEKRFYNVVEEIALAAGVPVPAVYVLRDEDGINACAIGGKLEDSAVAATAGAVELLTRDELQGVVAHEIGHLVNGDVKMNMRLIGVLAGLQALTIVGIHIIRAAVGRSKRGGVWILLFGLGVMGIGLIGSFFASAIQAAISRQRELLADASAAQFTRNSAGLAGALKKIGGLEKGSAVASERSVEAAHLFFGSVFNASLGERLFRTHPDLTERILALDPTFDGVFPGVLSKRAKKKLAAEKKRAEEARKKAEEVRKKAEEARREAREQLATLDGAEFAPLIASIGELRPEKLDGVSALLREIPAPVEALLDNFDGARTVVFALLVDVDAGFGLAEQRDAICRRDSETLWRSVVATAETLRALPFSTRSAVARLAVPALKSGTVDDYQRFRKTIFALCNARFREMIFALCDANERGDLFEFALQASVIRELDVWFGLAFLPKTRFSAFSDVREAFRTAATYLAFRGANEDEATAKSAFAAGVSALGDFAKTTEPLEKKSLENVDLETFYEAVERLAQTTPRLKEKLLTAFFACVAADGRVIEAEAELFDAISLALGVPAPIWRSVVDASKASEERRDAS